MLYYIALLIILFLEKNNNNNLGLLSKLLAFLALDLAVIILVFIY